MPTTVVKVKPDGKIEVGGKGFSGAECLEATKNIEAILGSPIEASRKLTEEFHEETTNKLHIGDNGGDE